MPEYAIETAALRREFGRNVAVAGLSLAVPRGEVFGFLGPNGAGKTTSLKLLLGLVAPTSGSGTVLGAPLGNTEVRARIGFLPEHFRFHDCLNARELLYFHGRLLGLPARGLETRIEALLLRVGLDDAAQRPLRTYSKGMTQRAGPRGRVARLARARVPRRADVGPRSARPPARARRDQRAARQRRHRVPELALARRGRGHVRSRRVREERASSCTKCELASAAGHARRRAALRPRRRRAARRARGVRHRSRRATTRSCACTRRPRACCRSSRAGSSVAASRVYELRCRRKTLEEWFVEVMGEDQRPG